ncbi:MAG: helix-turn-helix domain-containing protein [Sphingobium sp.]
MTAPPASPPPICVRVNDAAQMIGVGRTKLYELIAAGEIETIKFGKATRVTTASLHDLVRRRRNVIDGKSAATSSSLLCCPKA